MAHAPIKTFNFYDPRQHYKRYSISFTPLSPIKTPPHHRSPSSRQPATTNHPKNQKDPSRSSVEQNSNHLHPHHERFSNDPIPIPIHTAPIYPNPPCPTPTTTSPRPLPNRNSNRRPKTPRLAKIPPRTKIPPIQEAKASRPLLQMRPNIYHALFAKASLE